MSDLLVSLLDYKTTDIYIEPFGGGGRLLLNKPKGSHAVEIYNDSSAGMVALFELLSSRDTAFSLIRKLYETEFSEECFEKAVRHRNQIEDNYLQEELRQLKRLLSRLDIEHGSQMLTVFNRLLKRVYGYNVKSGSIDKIALNDVMGEVSLSADSKRQLKELLRNINTCVNTYVKHYRKPLSKDELEEITEQTSYILTQKGIDINDKKASTIARMTYLRLCNKKLKDVFMSSAENTGHDAYFYPYGMTSDEKIELAVSAYVVYMQSRDGAGLQWSELLYKTNDAYLRTIDKLYDVVHRLDGVQTFQIDAYMFFMGDGLELENGFSRWNSENVLMYCDPTYLQEDSNDSGNTGVRDIEEYNPGFRYKHYWTYEQHEEFLKCIQRAKCKILLSNYDDRTHLYQRYLVEGYGLEGEELESFLLNPWRRLDYETVTTVSQNTNKNNSRTECLWYNY